jgi:hypothetical protein
MSAFPDLGTENIGLCAFWNAVDQSTVDEISPMSATDYSQIVTQELYDNGVQGELTIPGNGNTGYYRIKSDGWVIAYLPSESEAVYGADNSDVTGQIDAIEFWNDHTSDSPSNALESIVNGLVTNLDQSSTITSYYNSSDVGYYSFDYTSAGGFSNALYWIDGLSGKVTPTFSPADGTNVVHCEVGGKNKKGDFHEEYTIYARFDGNDIYTTVPSQGLRDALALSGGSLSSGTNYTITIEDGDFSGHRMNAVAIWE